MFIDNVQEENSVRFTIFSLPCLSTNAVKIVEKNYSIQKGKEKVFRKVVEIVESYVFLSTILITFVISAYVHCQNINVFLNIF